MNEGVLSNFIDLSNDFERRAEDYESEFEKSLEAGDEVGLVKSRAQIEAWKQAAEDVINLVDKLVL